MTPFLRYVFDACICLALSPFLPHKPFVPNYFKQHPKVWQTGWKTAVPKNDSSGAVIISSQEYSDLKKIMGGTSKVGIFRLRLKPWWNRRSVFWCRRQFWGYKLACCFSGDNLNRTHDHLTIGPESPASPFAPLFPGLPGGPEIKYDK